MAAEASTSDKPFPGARSQVPDFRHEESESAAGQPGTAASLPLGASALPEEGGWSIRLRVRAEQIEVEKQFVVREQVEVRRRAVEGATHVTTDIRTGRNLTAAAR
jgi:stress response protein YsnF